MKNRAYAKINLCLNVVGKREDGYHELEMIMVPIDFYDVVDIRRDSTTSIMSNAKFLPTDDRNTVIKAINIIKHKFNLNTNYTVEVNKHIPTQAGLAGGSADAAAAIRILNKMEDLHLTIEQMKEIGKEVGADVPFCVENKPAIVKGIGENVNPFNVNCDFHILLVKPRMGVSTGKAFGGIDYNHAIHPNCDDMKEALLNGDYDKVISSLGNTLEQPSFALVPEIGLIKNKLMELGMDGALMSGSGSTVFGLTKSLDVLENAALEMKKEHYFIRKTKILK